MWAARFWRFGKRGWLRPWLVAILKQEPKNGAEIMDGIERMSWGHWRPSPGSVYPLLDELQNEGVLRKRDDGRYELTDKGTEEFALPFGVPAQGPSSFEEMVGEMSSFVSYFEDIAKSDKKRITPHQEKLKAMAARLARLSE